MIPASARGPDEERRRILRERAHALAIPARTGAAENVAHVVVFRLGRERYAIEATFIAAALPLTELSPIPGAAAPVFGLTLWRGTVLTVLDVRATLSLPSGALDDLRYVLVLSHHGRQVGVLVDAIEGSRPVPAVALSHHAPVVGGRDSPVVGTLADAVSLLSGSALAQLHR